MAERITITPEAAQSVAQLLAHHGALVFHQSGGCCDGSTPMCYPQNEFHIGAQDVCLGEVAGCPFYMSAFQFEYWRRTHLTLAVAPGRGSGFSLDPGEGLRFVTHSRLLSDEEYAELECCPPEMPPSRTKAPR